MMFAAGAEIPYVMAQVGHEDSKVTLQIYAQVLKRRDRDDIGRAFDTSCSDEITRPTTLRRRLTRRTQAAREQCAGSNPG